MVAREAFPFKTAIYEADSRARECAAKVLIVTVPDIETSCYNRANVCRLRHTFKLFVYELSINAFNCFVKLIFFEAAATGH